MNQYWGNDQFLRPPSEVLPIVPRKIEQDGFRGLVLVPDWPSQNRLTALTTMAVRQWQIEPKPVPSQFDGVGLPAPPMSPCRPRH